MLVSGVVAGLVLGLVVGRDWHRIEGLRIAWLPLLFLALIARALASFALSASFPLFAAGIAAVGVVATVNWRLPGAVLIAAGSVLNLLVVLANDSMPVDVATLEAIGGRLPQDALHSPLTGESLLGLLADVIPVAPVRAVYSVGDLAIATGGFLLPFVTLTRR